MFGDEADHVQASNRKFFVYGAIFVPVNSVKALHAEIELARLNAGLVKTDSLKSASSHRPKNISVEAYRDLKNSVMTKAREIGHVRFCAQVVLHELASNQSHDDLVLWGANTILGKFNQFLWENKTFGYAILDRLPVKDPYSYLKQKFQVGMTFPDKSTKRLGHIVCFAHAVDGSSHMCSVADVLLGAFRYCVNEPDNEEAGKAIYPTLVSMMWNYERDGKAVFDERGLVFRPQGIKASQYQAEYDALSERLYGYLSGSKS
jgi:hypothetical protein